MTKVAIISGATSANSRLNGIENEVHSFLTQEGIDYKEIKVRELPAEDLIYANWESEAIINANKIVEEADAVIILTPVYKASYTGVLKTYIDLLPQKGFTNKTVLPIVIGGTYGHLLVIDYALKPVLASMGATNLLSGVYVMDSQVERTGDNQFNIDAELKQRLQRSLSVFSEALVK